MSDFGKQGLTGIFIFLGSVGVLGNIRKRSVTKLISEGNEHYRKGRLADAVRAYNLAIKMDSDNSIAWNNKGLILAVAGNFKEALKCHIKAFELDPNHVDAISNIGMAHTKLDNAEEAIEWYDKAIKIDPKHETTWNNKGNLLSKLKRYEEAMKCYDQAIEINPNYLAAMNNKSVELIHLKHYDEALTLLNKVLKGRPLFSEGWYVKGKAYIGMGQFDKAIVCLERSHRLNPDFHQAKKALDVMRKKLVEAPGKKVESTHKHTRTEREQKKLEKSIEKEILKLRSEVEIIGDEFKRPDEHLVKEEKIVLEYLADDEKSKTALKNEIGNKLSMPAVLRGLEGLEKKGLITSSQAGRGTFYAKTEALGSIEEEIIEEPEEFDVSDNTRNDFHGLVTRGRRHIDQERYKDASSALKKALQINPYDDMAICLMAQVQYEMGDRDRAINTISKILSQKPDFIPAWFILANSSLKHGQYQDATECYGKILELQPDNSEARKGFDKAQKKL